MTLFDYYSGGLNVIIIALCEVVGVAWIYGSLHQPTSKLPFTNLLADYTCYTLTAYI